MSYLVLARKWRPQTFDDLIGQSHVSRTLANAIAADRVAHAFLFTWVRGVGKTTSARILAKALECEKGPTASPCLACAPCKEIAAGADVDVLEIDGASYNGVDEVRRLQETLPYRPTRDRFKLFIVDEVHMLSQSAWNAFLKTLEEPPPHVKFIFATTEVHKVPVTILSRCQRYDFKLIPTQLIAKRLRWVLEQEKIEADDASVQIIAREAAGSMRDGMSLLDQAIAWGGDSLRGEDVARVLGVAARSVLHETAAALVAGDAPRCLHVVAALADQGFDIAHVARDLLALLRDVVVAKVCKEPGELLDLADEEARDVRELAARTDADDLVRLHQGFSRAFDDVVRSGQPRAALEMALVRLARRPPLLPIDDLVAKLTDLERRLGGGGAPGPGPSGGGGPAPRPTREAPRAPIPGGASGGRAGGAPSRGFGASAAAVRLEESFSPPPRVAAEPSTPAPSPARAPSVRPVQAASAPPLPREPLPAAVDAAALRAILDSIRAERPALASVLEHAAPVQVGPESVVLAYEPESFLAAQAREEGAVDLLTRVVRAHFERPTPVAIELDPRANQRSTLASLDAAERHARLDAARRAVAEHPLVKAAIDVLGAELRDVRLQGEE